MGDALKGHIFSLLAALVALILPIKAVGLAIGFLVFVDIATGIWASVKEGKRLSSDRFRRTVTKSAVYLIALICAQVAEVHLFFSEVPIVKVVAGLIASTELISVGENLTRISGLDFRGMFKKILPEQLNKEDRGEGPRPDDR